MAANTRLHPIQVKLALQPPNARLGALIEFDGAIARIELVGTAEELHVSVADPARLRAILGRDDLTRLDAGVLVLCSTSYGVLAVATGPARPPARVACAYGVARLEDGAAVECPGDGEDQPSWQLVAIDSPASDARRAEDLVGGDEPGPERRKRNVTGPKKIFFKPQKPLRAMSETELRAWAEAVVERLEEAAGHPESAESGDDVRTDWRDG
ncbi:MAG: hypothetical protein U0V73_09385 [Acidimicrobiia bacterium]